MFFDDSKHLEVRRLGRSGYRQNPHANKKNKEEEEEAKGTCIVKMARRSINE